MILWRIQESKVHGIGVFPVIDLVPNQRIDTAINKEYITYFGSKINHSWTPTARLVMTGNAFDVYTIKSINVGTEITVDYTFTPYFIKKPDPDWK